MLPSWVSSWCYQQMLDLIGKWLPSTNTLAYLASSSATKKINFVTLPPVRTHERRRLPHGHRQSRRQGEEIIWIRSPSVPGMGLTCRLFIHPIYIARVIITYKGYGPMLLRNCYMSNWRPGRSISLNFHGVNLIYSRFLVSKPILLMYTVFISVLWKDLACKKVWKRFMRLTPGCFCTLHLTVLL